MEIHVASSRGSLRGVRGADTQLACSQAALPSDVQTVLTQPTSTLPSGLCSTWGVGEAASQGGRDVLPTFCLLF